MPQGAGYGGGGRASAGGNGASGKGSRNDSKGGTAAAGAKQGGIGAGTGSNAGAKAGGAPAKGMSGGNQGGITGLGGLYGAYANGAPTITRTKTGMTQAEADQSWGDLMKSREQSGWGTLGDILGSGWRGFQIGGMAAPVTGGLSAPLGGLIGLGYGAYNAAFGNTANVTKNADGSTSIVGQNSGQNGMGSGSPTAGATGGTGGFGSGVAGGGVPGGIGNGGPGQDIFGRGLLGAPGGVPTTPVTPPTQNPTNPPPTQQPANGLLGFTSPTSYPGYNWNSRFGNGMLQPYTYRRTY